MRRRAVSVMMEVRERMTDVTTTEPTLGLSEQQLREAFEKELLLAVRMGGSAPTVHAIAHSFARVVELDHLEMARQLRAAGVQLDRHGALPHPWGLEEDASPEAQPN
jgi:hypothetical protein